MKILRVQPEIDVPQRYNYKVNYGVWDEIPAYKIPLPEIKTLSDRDINRYDVVLLPMHSRWEGYMHYLIRLKSLKVKLVMFDNDSCYRSFDDPFYDGIDFIFYRITDKDGDAPLQDSAPLLWSVDTKYYTPVYGGQGVSFNCTVNHDTYKLRKDIARYISPTNYHGWDYVRHLQRMGAGIHTNSQIAPVPRAKILEFAACGAQIISNRMDGINDYFPDELITYFDNVPELLEIIQDFTPNIEVQKELRAIVEQKHSDEKRAKEVIETLEKVFFHQKQVPLSRLKDNISLN